MRRGGPALLLAPPVPAARLAASPEALDLRFLGFEVAPVVMARFRARFPDPGSHLDLECWDRFEAEHPDTSFSMYQLWCRPR